VSGLTRRDVLGKGAVLAVAAAAGAGGAVLATGGLERRRLDLHVDRLRSDAAPPAFGSMVSEPSAAASVFGEVADGAGRRTGSYFSSPLGPDSAAHTLALEEGTIVAIGPLGAAGATIAGGTGAFSRAAGTITIMRSLGAGGAPRADLAVELEL
jgi:hypothetical protein